MSRTSPMLFVVVLLAIAVSMPLARLQAQDADTQRYYRVELLVLRHLDNSSPGERAAALRSFAEALDLLQPETEEEAEKQEVTGSPEATTLPAGVDVAAGLVQQAEEPAAILLEDDQQSDAMREAWRRLRLSAGFRPEFYLAWDQPDSEPYPVVRVHDEELLYELQPKDGSLGIDGPGIASEGLEGSYVVTDANLQDVLQGLEQERPPPDRFYRLDGTAQLSRRRFLHLDLDLEWRELLGELPARFQAAQGNELDSAAVNAIAGADPATAAAQTAAGIESRTSSAGAGSEAMPFQIHRLHQRRQVRSEQMEYFDGPDIAVLAWISSYEAARPVDQENTP